MKTSIKGKAFDPVPNFYALTIRHDILQSPERTPESQNMNEISEHNVHLCI